MKILHILKSEPDETTNHLIEILSEGEEATMIRLYDGKTTDEQIINALFEHDKVISWW